MAQGNAPLAGLKAVALASLGPGPYAAMLLADLGCAVTIVDRIQPMVTSLPAEEDPRRRGQRSIALDLKQPAGRRVLSSLLERADIFMEGMRPGVTERLGFGPEACLAINPRLIYARVTGWGQSGPLAQTAGHDINYIALSGALGAMGAPGAPPPVPLNLLGDYAGGGLYVAFAILAALQGRVRNGEGCVIDGAILDGVASLTAAPMAMAETGLWFERGANVLAGDAPWYRSYRTRCGGYVAVGAIEDAFFAQLCKALGFDSRDWDRSDRSQWPAMAAAFERRFAEEDRSHWERVFTGSDACVTPVLSFAEASSHPHHQARGTYTRLAGIAQPAPGPKLGGPARTVGAPPAIGQHSLAILQEVGLDQEFEQLMAEKAVA